MHVQSSLLKIRSKIQLLPDLSASSLQTGHPTSSLDPRGSWCLHPWHAKSKLIAAIAWAPLEFT